MVRMANVTPSQLHPAEEVRYSLASAEPFTLSPGGSHKTDDRTVIAEASAHPWLAVEYDAAEAPVAAFRPGQIAPEDDALSALNSVAFDPEAVKRDREQFNAVEERTAIESGETQTEPKVVPPKVAITRAADVDQDDDEGTDR